MHQDIQNVWIIKEATLISKTWQDYHLTHTDEPNFSNQDPI